ncbi:MAG: OB-fold nucleic acid binding domain-containing protein [Oscillatoriaceae cyanobacterium]
MNNSQPRKSVAPFQVEGRFLGYIYKDGDKIKKLRLETAIGEYWFKLTKPLQTSLGEQLQPGDVITVTGESSFCLKTGKLKLKAETVERGADGGWQPPQTDRPSVAAANCPVSCAGPASSPATILVCEKSDCRKRGGAVVCQALEQHLRDRGLENQVTIKTTGCMKRCKAGPNIIIMPDKTRYSHIEPSEIPQMIDEHFQSQIFQQV